MGAQESLSQEKTLLLAPHLFGAITQNYINVGIDDSLMRYSGKYSTACLEAYSSSLQEELKSKLPDFMEKGGDALAGFSAVPHAVGVGALIISMILQVVFIATNGSQKSGDPSPMDMLRRVFAEEKASEVRDLMEEYLKRYEMHLRDSRRLLADSERLETQLSLQLTRLRKLHPSGQEDELTRCQALGQRCSLPCADARPHGQTPEEDRGRDSGL